MSTAARAIELLSYFTGLGPVGQPVALRRVEVLADLGLDHNTYNVCLNQLIAGRFVRRIAAKTVVVLRRPEEFA
ncbi:hypothetical protein C8D77_101244 [Mesorhizobium loti]|uniref:Uncharacterized protein n=1 Tax=Rhizobium loti TaxID=381 RepID=A0A8E2WIE8_RHILI|nr:hypothetical protein [Mesorhizobium loti]PWJ93565.1 hypothetical protein C8D77_101244 [Mesorhizobium loti]